MKAVVYSEYGSPDVLKLKDIEKPVPETNEILVKIHASQVNYGDLTARNFRNISSRDFNMPLPLWLPARMAFGFLKPRINILGSEFSGVIEAIGKDVKRFTKGDPVYGYRGMSMGANAEYLCISENSIVAHKPSNMSHEEASTIPYGAIMALNLLRKVNIQKGDKVLINGASGGIGSLAVQLARYYGAEVTGVCGTPRMEMVKDLGDDKVIDYTKEDFTENGEMYDLIFDILGRSSFSRCRKSLKENGRYLLASFKMKQLFQMLWTNITGGNRKKVICAMAAEKAENLVFIKELVESGDIRSVIDRCYPLKKTAEAHRYVENGDKKGSVVISVVNNKG
jgi:NADPH:quinone reductase-like Zn-dependent oxidoreductase